MSIQKQTPPSSRTTGPFPVIGENFEEDLFKSIAEIKNINDWDKKMAKPCLVMVYADWCGACNVFKPKFNQISLADTAHKYRVNGGIRSSEINEQEFQQRENLNQRLKISHYPTLIGVDSQGKCTKYTQTREIKAIENWFTQNYK